MIFTAFILGHALALAPVDLANSDTLPLLVEGRTRNERVAEYSDLTFQVTPPEAGTVDMVNPPEGFSARFIPADTYVGPVTITARGLNRLGRPIEGLIEVNVVEGPAVRLELTPGPPEPKS
jgi:hypothetical protein